MNKRLQKIFTDCINDGEQDLSFSVWQAICLEQKKKDARMLWKYYFLGIISLGALVPVLIDLISQFSQSGFYDYMSLLSSDGVVVATYWKEFMLSITESLPVTSITLSLLLFYILFISIRRVARGYKRQLLVA